MTPADPFAKMKLALVRSVLDDESPSREGLEHAFVEEFGAPPSEETFALFDRELKRREEMGLRPVKMRLNLIAGLAAAKRKERLAGEFLASGGQYVNVAVDHDTLSLLERLKQVYQVNESQELFLMALRMLEQQARRIAPEAFRYEKAAG
ncbi:MAG: hypothetical protein AB1921_10040 [Thermodesulfobacteriota bacterium]